MAFREHPQAVLSGKAPCQLLTQSDREALFSELGVKPLYISFREIASLSPAAFVRDIVAGRWGAAAVTCGYHFRFGAGAQGNPAMLRDLCNMHGLACTVVPRVTYLGDDISSSRIRSCIEDGNITAANAMLGRPFGYNLEVVHGEKIGRTIGFPTLNQLFPDNFCVPRFGVYASETCIENRWLPSVTNVGRRPSFACDELRSETHIPGFNGCLYGKIVGVRLLRYLRAEMLFDGLQALKKQLSADVEQLKVL
jgi:riboflavin kinase/FMN adenylyltransferase